MWPFLAQSHESCKKRHAELEERVRKLEGITWEAQLKVMDTAEKVAAKLKDRERKREDPEPERPRRPWEVPRGLPTR